MSEYRRGTHSVFQLHVHLVWCTKYRRAVLRGNVGYRLRELTRQVCTDMGVEILSGAVARDHVHLLVSMPPHTLRGIRRPKISSVSLKRATSSRNDPSSDGRLEAGFSRNGTYSASHASHRLLAGGGVDLCQTNLILHGYTC
jgi:REP element-mobilizing transposase RayT